MMSLTYEYEEDKLWWTLTAVDRAAVLRNTMFGTLLRQQTNQLQVDLRQTMRVYSSEKQELLKNLSMLRQDVSNSGTSDWSDATLSECSDGSSFGSPRRTRYYRSPNKAASTHRSDTSEGNEKTYTEKRAEAKREKELLKLPVIHSAGRRNSEWASGRNTSSKKEKQRSVDPLPGIAAAQAMLEDSIKIPQVFDPNRNDTLIDTSKSKQSRKKVTFADENQKRLSSFTEIEPRDNASKNLKNQPYQLPKLVRSKNQFGPKENSRKRTRRKKVPTSLDVEERLGLKQAKKTPKQVTETVNEWKSIYSNILDPEERTRALADILYAVRLKMFTNEQNLNSAGTTEKPTKTDSTLCDFLLPTVDNRVEYRCVNGQKRKSLIPSNTAGRLGRRSPALQLQSYLRQLSKSRRMIEHLEGEEYRLAHIDHHKTLHQAATEVEVAA